MAVSHPSALEVSRTIYTFTPAMSVVRSASRWRAHPTACRGIAGARSENPRARGPTVRASTRPAWWGCTTGPLVCGHFDRRRELGYRICSARFPAPGRPEAPTLESGAPELGIETPPRFAVLHSAAENSMPPKERPRSRSAGTGSGKANSRVVDPGGEGRHADPDLPGHPPTCTRGLSPTATTSMQLLPTASGEKNRSTSSSKNVSPVAPKRCAYDARYTLPATVPASSCAVR